jgi:dolichol-phosphate mannosyltransferase
MDNPLTIIIPVLNEEDAIPATLRALIDAVPDTDIVVVDDHSTDGTPKIVESFAAEHPRVRLVHNEMQPGFANALKTGFESATTEFVLPVMGDLCDEVAKIPEMLEVCLDGDCDLVCGSRYIKGGRKEGGPRIQSFFSWLFGVTIHVLTGIPTHDISNSFKMYRKSALETITIESSMFEVSMEMTLKVFFQGGKVAEVPTVWLHRKQGESKFRPFSLIPVYGRWYRFALAGAIKRRLGNPLSAG